MRRPRRFAIAIIALVMTSVCTLGQQGLAQPPAQLEAPAPAKRTLIVGTKEAPPFAIKNPDGSWRGISIELWREIARDLHVDYEFRETSLTGLFNGVQSREFDLAIAAISITADRENLFDFTQPYYNSGLGIAVNRKKTSNFFDVLLKFMSWDILRLVGALAPGSPLRKPINQAILKKLRSPEWQELLRRNLGDPEM